ncbi:uncharacterized protein K452DRAFT_124591 [Aplosporella prunicola CBS 121167]|uniref:Uncharacterized protein n=1 Tax=Aplosporella prunicola CBS 121167 TaxID=1176127 RepID=A0A6A6BNQ0_9PEZI|nr:uncharacterized protein K452DRAFT_124591 [Aplosporella prunicola CBS 121167]KAF2145732.1 hypothetical protein K452DRAFT_124591 [Aplosporella prunicola CBS 121167]
MRTGLGDESGRAVSRSDEFGAVSIWATSMAAWRSQTAETHRATKPCAACMAVRRSEGLRGLRSPAARDSTGQHGQHGQHGQKAWLQGGTRLRAARESRSKKPHFIVLAGGVGENAWYACVASRRSQVASRRSQVAIRRECGFWAESGVWPGDFVGRAASSGQRASSAAMVGWGRYPLLSTASLFLLLSWVLAHLFPFFTSRSCLPCFHFVIIIFS